MRSLSAQRRAGEGRDLGRAKSGRRLNTGRWRRAEVWGRRVQLGFCAPALRESLLAPEAPRSLGQHWAAPVFVFGDLAPPPPVSPRLARVRVSKSWPLPGP